MRTDVYTRRLRAFAATGRERATAVRVVMGHPWMRSSPRAQWEYLAVHLAWEDDAAGVALWHRMDAATT